jgi:hypothetical protein
MNKAYIKFLSGFSSKYAHLIPICLKVLRCIHTPTSPQVEHFQDHSNGTFSQYFLLPLANFLQPYVVFSQVFFFSSTQMDFLLHLVSATMLRRCVIQLCISIGLQQAYKHNHSWDTKHSTTKHSTMDEILATFERLWPQSTACTTSRHSVHTLSSTRTSSSLAPETE